MPLTPRETAEVERVNAGGRTPVVFIHGLWLLASSWEPWLRVFEEAGYTSIAPGWPDEPETMAEANARPEAFAGKRVAQVVEHFEEVVRGLERKPVLIGHSFGGLFAQMLAGRGLASACVAIDPAAFRGVLPVPPSTLRAASPVLRDPLHRGRAVALTAAQFRYAFANAVSEDEARALYSTYAVPGAAGPVFEVAFANVNPRTAVRVDTHNPARGPLLLVAGERDHIVPASMVRAAFGRQRRNAGVTELVTMAGRGHSLTIDSGWREVADVALAFLRRVT